MHYVIWGLVLVSFLFSLYKKLDLNKLVPTEVSLQMADKSTAVPIGICEDVPISVANVIIVTSHN